MSSRLKVDLKQGTLEVEGDEAFVREAFDAFREQMFSVRHVQQRSEVHLIEQDAEDLSPVEKEGAKKIRKDSRGKGAARRSGDAKSKGVKTWSPNLDNDLQIEGLKEFVEAYKIKNHAERILIYGKYLESKGINLFNADQIYTLYSVQKVQMPRAFAQAFIDARGAKYQYIDFENLEEIRFTITGHNHFNHHIVKRESKT